MYVSERLMLIPSGADFGSWSIASRYSQKDTSIFSAVRLIPSNVVKGQQQWPIRRYAQTVDIYGRSKGRRGKKRVGTVPSCSLREVGRLDQRSLSPWLLACGGWLHGKLLDSRRLVGSVCERSVDGSVCGHVERMRWGGEVEIDDERQVYERRIERTDRKRYQKRIKLPLLITLSRPGQTFVATSTNPHI